MQIHLKINSPHVVHDSFDGETILVNLKNGNYYSFEKLGSVIWELIDKKVTLISLIEFINRKFPEAGNSAGSDVDTFLQNLLQENLIIEDTGSDLNRLTGEYQFEEKLINERVTVYEPPLMNKYTDMKDMLLLDPIHDTDEKGWPSGKVE